MGDLAFEQIAYRRKSDMRMRANVGRLREFRRESRGAEVVENHKGLDHPSRDLRQDASDGEAAKVVLMRFENEVDDQMAPRGEMVAINGPTRLSGTAVVFFTARTTILLSMLETSPRDRIRSRRKSSKVCMSRVTMRNS